MPPRPRVGGIVPMKTSVPAAAKGRYREYEAATHRRGASVIDELSC